MFSLKFISGKYQGGEFPLTPGKQLIIGRSPELELALVEDMVSRKHAKLTVTGDGRITLEDLGSSNGTFVNGEQITRPTRLREGDRVLIGTSILKLVQQGTGEMEAALRQGTARPNLETVAKVASQRKTRLTSMTGNIEELAIADLLQLFGTSRKNGVLAIKREDGSEARIYLRQGKIYYALLNGDHRLGPLKSFRRILRWQSGEFELCPPEATEFDDELDVATDTLLLGAHHEIDELKHIEAELPFATKIRPVRPLDKPLRDLTPEQLDVFQLVYNHIGPVQSALDRSHLPDFETARAILDLLHLEYLQRA
ncbi:MAG: FHA domain-containing protein [Myxococcaceae bacterium]|nr:FHA domain-containing protein [Myxococcaceae bacterium]